jgi:hypothetical protein
MLPPNTIPAPPGKFPKPDPTAPAPLAPGEPEFDFTALSPPLRPNPPTLAAAGRAATPSAQPGAAPTRSIRTCCPPDPGSP